MENQNELLTSCHSLEKFSMRSLMIFPKIVENLFHQNGKTLQVLSLYGCKGFSLESIKLIVNNCLNLKEINFSHTDLQRDELDYLASNLTPQGCIY